MIKLLSAGMLFPFLLIFLMGILPYAYAHQGCIEDALGKIICPPPGGGIEKTATGEIVCGKGECVKTFTGSIKCSRQAGGYSYIDKKGHAVCTEGCEDGSRSLCQIPY
jgi:hypothetical protein